MKIVVVKLFLALYLLSLAGISPNIATSSPAVKEPTPIDAPRHRYQIDLKIDFDARSYSGSERVRWVNRGNDAISVLYFHLYSNLRPDGSPTSTSASSAADSESEEPRIEITEVRSAAHGAPLTYSIDDHGTTLRISLGEQIASGKSTEVVIGFKGNVPEVDADETGLTSHVVKQVSAAIRGERELRRPRDLNFRCRGVMLLGTAYPVLAVHEGDEWVRKLEPSVGDIIFNEVADYDVKIEAPPGVVVFTSAWEKETKSEGEKSSVFSAGPLREFAIIAGRNLRSEQTRIGETTIRSIFVPEHATVGRRVLTMAADSFRIFSSRFGPLPFQTINIAEAPLVAGLGSTEFSGIDVIASAFYILIPPRCATFLRLFGSSAPRSSRVWNGAWPI